MFLMKNDEQHLHTEGESKPRPIHWALLLFCVTAYIAFMIIQIVTQQYNPSEILSKYTLNGIVAQGQVVMVILITLNPIKRSHLVVILLCSLTAILAFRHMIDTQTPDSLPGIVIPTISIFICLIIYGYSERQKKQIQTISEYSRTLKENEKQLHSLAYYDGLTGLPNRQLLFDNLRALINQGQSSVFSFVLVDIDDFKNINDTMGHRAGDAVLKSIAARWVKLCCGDDMVARIGGDEFAILIRQQMDQASLSEYLGSFKNALREPITVENKDFHVYASFGVATYPDDGIDMEGLFKNTDIALYKTKHLGKNGIQFFSKVMQKEVTRKLRLEDDLRSAINNNELYMVYQPQYSCKSLKLEGVEALLRWNHPELGAISPAEFIPVAEESGTINEIGEWVIKTVLNTFMNVKKQWGIETDVSVNISVKQLLEPSFVTIVRGLLDTTGFDSKRLVFEITESVFITSPQVVIDVLNQIKAMGIEIALDDFGTGYASLNYLQMLPIRTLKIDRVFVSRISRLNTTYHMVGAIISLAHKLGLKVVAEGVETAEQLNYLIKQKCDGIQGYMLSKPLGEDMMFELCSKSVS